MSLIDTTDDEIELPPEGKARLMLGTFIKTRRRALGMKGNVLAAKAGITPSHLSRIERGERTASYKYLPALAEALDVSVMQLRHIAGESIVQLDPVPEIEAQLDRIRVRMVKMTDIQQELFVDLIEAAANVIIARHAMPHPPLKGKTKPSAV